MSIKPIKKVKIGEQVYEQLKEMLIKGEWKQGDKLPSENTLAEEFGVSRITVRQALQKLSAVGLIETRVGEGSFVRKVDVGEQMQGLLTTLILSGDEFEQVFEFRQIIDVESARLAVKHADKKNIKELKAIHNKMLDIKDNISSKKFAELDTAFHSKISEMTGNSLIVKSNEILREVINSYVGEIIQRMGVSTALEYHGRIIEAIEAGDEKAAANIMKEHLDNNIKYIEEIKAER